MRGKDGIGRLRTEHARDTMRVVLVAFDLKSIVFSKLKAFHYKSPPAPSLQEPASILNTAKASLYSLHPPPHISLNIRQSSTSSFYSNTGNPVPNIARCARPEPQFLESLVNLLRLLSFLSVQESVMCNECNFCEIQIISRLW